MDEETKVLDLYSPSKTDSEIIQRVYKDFSYMRDLRNMRYNYFNDRTLKEFTDDSELRVTGFVPTREEQGKEEWQANFFHPTTRNKMKAVLAAVALDVPDTRFTAVNEKNMKSFERANIAKNLVKYSYDRNTNKEEDIYFEGWECASKGTVHVYEGYQRTKVKRKFVKSYDPTTGDIETDEKEVIAEDGCVSFIIDNLNVYIWDFFIQRIQDQPKIQWVERMDRSQFWEEFGKYPNAKFVKTSKDLIGKDIQSRYFMEGWQTRLSRMNPIEVVRHYDKHRDEYIIIANGVLLFNAPMLLGKKKKWYPIAKTIYEPFSAQFYYGNSLPNAMMGEQDVINALYNSAVDKTYKSLMPPLLIGNVNKDDFDLEDSVITHDTKIYVQDINQVKPLEAPTMKQADISMIDIISRGLDLTTVDANQQGIAGRGVTAREVVIAHENAKKLKGVLYMFLTSLWIQKMKLRLMNILSFYTQSKLESLAGEDKDTLDKYKRFLVENTTLATGRKGTLGITVVPNKEQLPTAEDMTARETDYKAKNPGEDYEEIAMTSDYLDDWEYDIKVVSESIFQNESSYSVAKMEDKIKLMAEAFPEFFQLNKEMLFKQTLISYNDDPDDYDLNAPQAPAQPSPQPGQGGQPVQPGQPVPGQEGATQGTPRGSTPMTNMQQ